MSFVLPKQGRPVARMIILGLSVTLCLISGIDPVFGQGILVQTTFHELGINPVSMDFADLDGDGLDDGVVANRVSGDVTVLFGQNQPPYFSPPISVPTGGLPMDVLLQDVKGDSRPEILTLNTGTETLSIHEVALDRTIIGVGEFSSGSQPSRLFVADLDDRNILDVAILSKTNGTLTILRGLGEASFGAPVTVDVGPNATKAEFGDFDGDGLLDLAVTLQLEEFLNVFRSQGDVVFDPPVPYSVPGGSLEMLARDVTGNGIIDLTVMSRGSGKVTVLRGLGDGTFDALEPVYAGDTLRDMVVRDVTLDGIPEVIVAASNGNALVVLEGQGEGQLGPPLSLPAGTYPFEVAVADLSFDEIPDLICANLLSNNVTIYEGLGGMSFAEPPTTLAIGRRPVLMTSQDLNGDGPPELIVAHYASDDLGLLVNEKRLRQVMAGNVNAGAGGVSDVLFVNDEVGDSRREVHVELNESVTIRMDSSPAGPSMGAFVLYVLASEPGVNGVTTQPGGVGEFAFSTPLTGGGNRLIVLVNNLGHIPLLGEQTVSREVPPAPTVVVRRLQGFSRSSIVTLQGFIADFGAGGSQPISVTNAVTLFLGK